MEKPHWSRNDNQLWMVWITNGVAVPILQTDENEFMTYEESGNEVPFVELTLEQAYHICVGYNMHTRWE